MLLLRDTLSKLPALLSLHDGPLGLSATLESVPPGILALVRLLSPPQECRPGSSILTPARASRVSYGTLDVLTRMQAVPTRRPLN